MASSDLFDVIIIGAGLSGLSAATILAESSPQTTFLVLEARDRIGGKALSRSFAGAVADMGPAWINDTNQSKMCSLAKRFGLETIKQNTRGDIAYADLDGSVHRFGYGGVPQNAMETGGVENMVEIRDQFERLCHKIDLADPVASCKALGKAYDEMSVADFVRREGGGETALATVRVWTRAMLGLESQEVSALYFLAYCKGGGGVMQMRSDRRDGGQFLRLAKGELGRVQQVWIDRELISRRNAIFRPRARLPSQARKYNPVRPRRQH
jgi:monoamine oxidase